MHIRIIRINRIKRSSRMGDRDLQHQTRGGVLPEGPYALSNSTFHIVLSHLPILVRQQLLRVRKVARISRGLRPNVPELKIHLRQRAGLVKA